LIPARVAVRTIVVFAALAVTPAYSQTVAPNAVHHPPGGYAGTQGGRLWYEIEGQGEPVLLIAGGPGSSHNYFHPGLSALSDSFRIVYFDSYGRGRSDRAASASAYTVNRDVEDVDRLRRALGLGRVHLVGHSYGGMVAIAYALAHPGAVKSLTIASAPISGQSWQAANENFNRTLRSHYPEAWDSVVKLRAKGRVASDSLHRAAFQVAHPAMMFLFNGSNGAVLRASSDSLSWNPAVYFAIAGRDADFHLGGSAARLDFRGTVGKLRMPVLVIAGRFDREIYPRLMLEYRRYAPRARFVMFERSGHFPFIEEPEVFERTMREFLTGSR